MMEYLEFILLGVLQGITEFLPISSSGHLLLGRKLFNINEYGIIIEVFLHLGTLFSILLFWSSDIKYEIKNLTKGNSKYFNSIIIGTIPAAILGFLFNDYIENIFFDIKSIKYLSYNYLLLSIIIYVSKYFMDGTKNEITYKIAFLIGIIQSFAILPGLSRSGLTIILGLYFGLNFKTSSKFSFMLAIPILIFASLNSLIDYLSFEIFSINMQLIIGCIFSFISGYYVLIFLHSILQSNKFWYFSFYCFSLSMVLFYGV